MHNPLELEWKNDLVELIQITPNEYHGVIYDYSDGIGKIVLYFDLFVSKKEHDTFTVPFMEENLNEDK